MSGVGGKVWVLRTERMGTGMRSIWVLPGGSWLHAIEDRPIPAGRYFLVPDDTGRFRNWVIEKAAASRCAAPAVLDCFGRVEREARRDIEVHVGNTMDDTHGCFCLGMETAPFGVAHSAAAIAHAREVLRRDDPDPPDWTLEIVERDSSQLAYGLHT